MSAELREHPVSSVKEQATLLGARKSLVGIIAQGAPASGTDRPAVVILNAGIVHRVGPNRMFVRLARRLAAAGSFVVRFDLSGIGDSETRNDGLAPLDSSLADIREVLDTLESTRQIRRVVLVGLCSGADQAVIYGANDPRVVGVVMIDPSIPPTWRYHANHLRGRVFRVRSWLNLASPNHPLWRRLSGRAAKKPAKPARPAEEASAIAMDAFEMQRPAADTPEVRTFLERAYAGACASGVQFLTVLTGDRGSQHNYREQLLDAFPRVPLKSRMQLEYYTAADHTFTAEAHREWLLQLVEGWIEKRA